MSDTTHDPVAELLACAKSASVLIARLDADIALELRIGRAIKAVEEQRERGGLYVIEGGGKTHRTDDPLTAQMTAFGLALTTSPDEVRVTDSRTGDVITLAKKGA